MMKCLRLYILAGVVVFAGCGGDAAPTNDAGTGNADTAVEDAGSADASAPDTGAPDAGTPQQDTGGDDGGSTEDAAAEDAGAEDTAGADAEPELCEYTITEHLQPLLQANCANGYCHGSPTDQSGLNLEGPDYASLFNRPAQGDPDVLLTAPGNPFDSLIWQKLVGAQRVGRDMPIGGQLADDQVELVRGWILGGVVNETFRARCGLEL